MALTPENRMEQILNGENITPEDRSEYFVKKAIDNAGSGGSSLPTPGTAGNVMTSTGTAWASAAPRGAEYVVTITVDTSGDDPVYTADKSVLEIAQKSTAGSLCIALVPIDNDNSTRQRVPLLNAGDGTVAFYGNGNADGSPLRIACLGMQGEPGSDDTWFVMITHVTDLPSVSASDNGKFLGVSDGAYALIDAKPLIVTGTWTDGSGSDPSTITITTPLADIYNAAEAGRSVYLEYTNDGVTTRLGLTTRALDNGSYSFGFSGTMLASSTVGAIVVVAFANSLVGSVGYVVTGS